MRLIASNAQIQEVQAARAAIGRIRFAVRGGHVPATIDRICCGGPTNASTLASVLAVARQVLASTSAASANDSQPHAAV